MNNDNTMVAPSHLDTEEAVPNNQSFRIFNADLQAHVDDQLATNNGIVFMVELGSRSALFDSYLQGFEEGHDRQWHNCSCCKSFLRRYGGLVTVNPTTGETKALLWDETKVSDYFAPAVKRVRELVEAAPIRSVFYPERGVKDLGEYKKGNFNHFCVLTNGFKTPRNTYLSIQSQMASSPESFKTLSQHLAAFDQLNIDNCAVFFENDATLKNYPHFVDGIKWFADLKRRKDAIRNSKLARNLVWYAVATESPGRLVFGNTVGGTFIENVTKNMPFEDAKRAFLAMVDPRFYQRPQVAATSGNIEQAEQIIAKMGLASALKRRFFRFDEITQFKWQPKAPAPAADEATGGVFGHLKPKDAAPAAQNLPSIDGGTVTWRRFAEEVLPKADELHVMMNAFVPYKLLIPTTAVDPEAKPILSWDREDRRNPVSAYVHIQGLPPRHYNLDATRPIKVKAISVFPELLATDEVETSHTAFVVLEGAYDASNGKGLALFPQILRQELHGVRATIEQFSNQGELEGREQGCAGIAIPEGDCQLGIQIVVTSGAAKTRYFIDRVK
jgi:hypothetical protein